MKNVALSIGSIAACLLIAEIVLSFLPVTDSPMLQPVTSTENVPHYKPNRDITWSKGWNFSIVNRRHINNYGFSDYQDYDPNNGKPLLAVIGDSYVQSWMVPYEASIQGRLTADAAGRARVYSFGVSGAQLSTYLVFAEYAREVFRPAGMVVVIVGNDFDESLLAYKAKPKLTYFRDDDEGGLALKTVAYNPSPLVRVLRKSTLMRYLFLNMGLKGVVTSSLKFLGGSERPVFIANTLAQPSPERVRSSKRAVDAFLARLPEAAGLTSEHIVFVVDGIRQQIYGDLSRETVEASFVHQIRSYFMANARALGYEVIDMHAVFGDYYRHNGKRFEFPKDNHWNSLGHGIAALAVRRSRVFSTFETGKE